MTWKTARLEDVCKIVNGSTPSRSKNKFWTNGKIPWFTIDDFREQGRNINDTHQKITKLAISETSSKLLPKNTVLLCCTASVGVAAIARIEMATNQQFNGLIPNLSKITPGFLYYISTTLTQKLLSVSGSATINFIAVRKLKEIKIKYPSIIEQQRIVTKLDIAFSEIDKVHDVNIRLIKSIEIIQKTLLKLLLKKENKIKKVKLEDICIIKGRIGYRGYTKKDITTKGMGSISLSPSNINKNKLVFKKITYVSWDKYNESPEIMIYPGDIIFCKTGSTYGKTAYINDLPEKATLNPQLVVLKNIKCNNKFLFYSMLSDNFKFQIEDIIGGSAMPTLSQKDLSQTEVLLPCENIQEDIVNKIEQITKYSEQMDSIIKSKIKNFLNLKEKILQKEINQNI